MKTLIKTVPYVKWDAKGVKDENTGARQARA